MGDPVMPLFADAGPGPLIVPILGGLGVAGAFLAAAVVAGGILARFAVPPRREHESSFSSPLRCSVWVRPSCSACSAKPSRSSWLAAAVLAVMGVGLLIVLRSVAPARERHRRLD